MTSLLPEPLVEVIPYSNARRQEELKRFSHLWKLDNQDWVSQRETDWNFLVYETGYADLPKDEERLYEEYFKFGRMNAYITPTTLLFLTPYTSAEQVKDIVYSEITGGMRDFVFNSYFAAASREQNCHWYRQHMQLFIEGVLGDTYKVVKESSGTGRQKMISLEATYWCDDFAWAVREGLQQDTEYIPYYDCVNYFITALPFASVPDVRERVVIKELMDDVTKSLAEKRVTGRALKVAEQLKQNEQLIWDNWALGEQRMLQEQAKG